MMAGSSITYLNRKWATCLCYSILVSILYFFAVNVTGFSSPRGRGFGQAASAGRGKKQAARHRSPALVADKDDHPLLDWLGTFPESEFNSIEIRASECGDGMGVFLTKPVEDGDIVLAVPSNAFVSVSNALEHPSLGPAFRKLWTDTEEDDPKGSSVLAALLAHLLLNLNAQQDENRDVYLKMLPREGQNEKHALWWTDTEVELIRGTSGYQEWVEMREDVDEMSDVIIDSGVLTADVAKYGNLAVKQALRTGFVSVLSRAYGVFSNDGREFKACIPLLDQLNHASIPNVQYSYEGVASETGLSGLLVGRAKESLEKGEELTISYGSHPDHIFGLYFGFIPSHAAQSPRKVEEATRVLIDSISGGAVVRQCCTEMALSMIISDMNVEEVSG